MKKNIFQIALVALVAGLSVISCQKIEDQDNKIEKPVLVSISADKLFSAGSATVTAKLSAATDREVKVELTTGTKLSQDFTELIDDKFITLGTITIPAGQQEASTTVSVDYSTFEKGKYETQILVAEATGASASSANSANIILLCGSSLVKVAFDDYLDNAGIGTFTVSMDMFSETDCEVSLGYVFVDGAGFVPEDAITMSKKVVVKAGETKTQGVIAADLDKLDESGFWYVGVVITGVSEGPFEASTKATYSGMDFILPVNMSEEWGISYIDKEFYEGDYSEIYAQMSVSTKYFDYYITGADVVPEEVPASYVYPEFIAYENEYLDPYIKTYGVDILEKYGFIQNSVKTHYFTGKNRAAGKYKLWVLGLGEDGYCTGEYAVADFEVVDDDPEFAAWLGKWTIGTPNEGEKPVVISINTASQNFAYTIDGLEGLDTADNYLTALGFLAEGSGAMDIYSNAAYYGIAGLIYEGEDGKYYADVLLGEHTDGEVAIDSFNYPLAAAVFGADGNGYLTPGFGGDGKTYVSMKYYTISTQGDVVKPLTELTTYTVATRLVPYEEPKSEIKTAGELVPRNGFQNLNPKRFDRKILEQMRNR